ncbi:hypothetical protein K6Q96_06735 [Grimontia kaedaensis]|uniref:RiboL-PSP-HEPN domain-containing protein n=1 Tax=Grimontia kaedaensis TaxID=2872157 RepID=A0ABY4WXI3_9GAMM|nr:hypothetical protein [Grimontia kaedaensis]USH03683.1 hypothetical protein K6Q96_06735 [Grimontia kaedaensis]
MTIKKGAIVGTGERIAEVHDFLRERLNNIHDIQAHSDNLTIMRAILYTSFIDALGATRYGKEVNTRERFTRVIIEHGNWPEAEKICPMHLHRFLEVSPGLPEVLQKLNGLLNDWQLQPDGIIYLDSAPHKDEIAELWPDQGKRKHHKKKLEHFTHVNLLYGMRNGLLHQQYSANGFPLFPKEHKNVHYVYWNKGEKNAHLELIHPSEFLGNLCDTLLENVMNDFETKKEKPWETGHFPSYLIDGLY